MPGDPVTVTETTRRKIESLGAAVANVSDSRGMSYILCTGDDGALAAVEKEMKRDGWSALRDETDRCKLLLSQKTYTATREPPDPSTLLFFSVVVFCVCVYMMQMTVKNAWLMFEGKDWVSAPAQIDREEVRVTQGPKSGPHYHPHIWYHFSVGGAVYRGDTFSIPETSKDSDADARAVLSRYGRTTDIYYYPDNPDHNSVLRPYVDDLHIAIGAILCCVLFLFWARLTLGYLSLRNNKPAGPPS